MIDMFFSDESCKRTSRIKFSYKPIGFKIIEIIKKICFC